MRDSSLDLNQSMLDDPSAFSLLHQLYQSDLSFRVQNDVACRILTLRYHAISTSILLYNGLEDALINYGSYLRPCKLRFVQPRISNSNAVAHFFDHVTFYDYLYHKFEYTGIPYTLTNTRIDELIENFKSAERQYFNYRFPLSILTSDFVKKCHQNSILLATSGTVEPKQDVYKLEANSFFQKYKRDFKNIEQYSIGKRPGNFSGWLYHMVLNDQFKMPSLKFYQTAEEFTYRPGSSHRLKKHQKTYLVELTNLLKIRASGPLEYVGLPLWANDRCIGIVRMLYDPMELKNPFLQEGNLQAADEKKVDRKKSLRHAMEMIGSFIDLSYRQAYFDNILHDWTPNRISKLSSKKLENQSGLVSLTNEDIFCNGIRKSLDSFGCILRMHDESSNRAKIVGYSKDSPDFGSFVRETLIKNGNDGFIRKGKFVNHVRKYFPSIHAGEKFVDSKYKLVGISVKLTKDVFGNFEAPTYYFCYWGEESVRKTSRDYIFKTDELGNPKIPKIENLFDPKAYEILRNIQIQGINKNETTTRCIEYVLIIDIPSLHVDGILTLCNTTNRFFTLADVKFAYGEMKRLALEKRRVNEELKSTVMDISNKHLHEAQHLIDRVYDMFAQLQRDISINNEVDVAKLKSAGITIMDIEEWLEITRKKIEICGLQIVGRNSKLERYQHENWDIEEKIIKYKNLLSKLGRSIKGTGINFVVDTGVKTPVLRNNETILSICLFNLLDNALKYSFNLRNKHLDDQVKNHYVEEDISTIGHVQVLLEESKSHLKVSVTSWGFKVSNKERVFERHRSKADIDSAQKFLAENNRGKDGNTGIEILMWQKSSGLGLSSIKQLLEQINSTCECSSDGVKNVFILSIKK